MDISQWLKTIDSLKNLQFLNNIPEEIKAHARVRIIKKGTYVTEKGAEISSVKIFCKGHMQVKNEFANGMVYVFASIEPIAYIGAMELLADSSIYSAFLQAKTECEVLEIPNEYFLKWIYSDKALMFHVLKFISKSMFDQSWSRGESVIYPSIFLVTKYIVDNYKKCGKDSLCLNKSACEISTFFGVSVRTVQRALKQLKEKGFIDTNRNEIIVNSKQYNILVKSLKEMEEKL